MNDATSRWVARAVGPMRIVGMGPLEGCAWVIRHLSQRFDLPRWVLDDIEAELASSTPANEPTRAERLANDGDGTGDRSEDMAKLAVSLGDVSIAVAAPADHIDYADLVGVLFESLLPGDDRKRSGSHYTPRSLADGLAYRSIALWDETLGRPDLANACPHVLDPSSGGGAFLLAAARRLHRNGVSPEHIWSSLHGTDISADAVVVCRAALALLFATWGFRSEHRPDVACNDFLGSAPTQVRQGNKRGRVDVVIGNPPFLTPLRRRTSIQRPTSAGSEVGRVGAYTDTAAVFLLRSVELVDAGGIVCLIQPQSMASARDARQIRSRIDESARVVGVWIDDSNVFSASTNTWAPVLSVGSNQPDEGNQPAVGHDSTRDVPLTYWFGVNVAPSADPKREAASHPVSGEWGWYLARSAGIPQWGRATSGRSNSISRLGDFVTATAGFRDEFYACAAAAVEMDSDLDATPTGIDAFVVTTGMIDPGIIRWGERPVRLNKRQFVRPIIDWNALHNGPHGEAVARWVQGRLRPKCLLAVQTRVLEAAVDPDGRFVPITPVISVESDRLDPFEVFAALSSPVATLWAHERASGSGLGRGTIRLSAAAVREVPVPADIDGWIDCGNRLRAAFVGACGTGETPGAVGRVPIEAIVDVGRMMGELLGVDEAGIEWWMERLAMAQPDISRG